MRNPTRLACVVLLAVSACCGVARAQPGQPAEYATIAHGEDDRIWGICFSPDGDRLSYILTGKKIVTWDVKTKKSLKEIHKPEDIIEFRYMASSPGGRMLAVTTVSAVYHLDVRSGKCMFLHRHGAPGDRTPPWIDCVRYSQDGKRIVSADDDGVIKVWDVEMKAVASEVRIPNSAVLDVALVPGTDRAFVSTEEASRNPKQRDVTDISYKLLLADLKTREVKTVSDHIVYFPAHYQGSTVSADGKLFAMHGGKGVLVRSTATLKTEADLKCPLDAVVCRFSDSGRLLIAGGSTKGVPTLFGQERGEVAIYDRETRKWVSHFRVLDREVHKMALSPKGDLLAVASSKLGTITVWDLSPMTEKLPKVKEKDSEMKRP